MSMFGNISRVNKIAANMTCSGVYFVPEFEFFCRFSGLQNLFSRKLPIFETK